MSKKYHVYALRKTLLCVPELAHHSKVALNPSVSQETEKQLRVLFKVPSLEQKTRYSQKIFPYFSVRMGVLHHTQQMDCKSLIGGRSVVYHH